MDQSCAWVADLRAALPDRLLNAPGSITSLPSSTLPVTEKWFSYTLSLFSLNRQQPLVVHRRHIQAGERIHP